MPRATILRVGAFPMTSESLDGWYFEATPDCQYRCDDGRGETLIYGWRMSELQALWLHMMRN